MDLLKSEGVSPEAIDNLNNILTIRACMPGEDIDRVLSYSGAYDHRSKKEPIGNFLPKTKSYEEISFLAKTIGGNQSLSTSERTKQLIKEVKNPIGTHNKYYLSGLNGAVQAYLKGFTPEQVQGIKNILSSKGTDVTEYKFQNVIEPPTPEQLKKLEEIPTLLAQGKAEEVYPKPDNLDAELVPEYNSWIEKIKAVFTSPKMKDIAVVNMIGRAKPTQAQKEAILELFADKNSNSPALDVINKRLQTYNIIGQNLWGNYIPALSEDIIDYTEHYHEAPKSRLHELHEPFPNDLTLEDIVRKAEIEPVIDNTATEEIMHLRLARLAKWYGLDVEQEDDAIRFNMFMHEFDVSPGERTLEWCLDVHPPDHTFEELAIIKIPSGEKIEDNL